MNPWAWIDDMQRAFVSLGYDDDTASTYAAAVGDTPQVEGDILSIPGPNGSIIDTVSNSAFQKAIASVGG